MKVFDNLYYVGEREYSAWAVTTSAGIIIIDPIYDYSVEEQVVGGLKKLGLDPAQIKYVVVSHAHRDHAGGAWYLQERFGARVLLTAPDWEMLERNKQNWPKPKRDMVVTDGQQLTLGDTTLTFVHTFGHTPGTMSTIVPVKDNGKPHVAALWGGTGLQLHDHAGAAGVTLVRRLHRVRPRDSARRQRKPAPMCSSRIIRAGMDRTTRWRGSPSAQGRRAASVCDRREEPAELLHDRRALRESGKAACSRWHGEVTPAIATLN